MNTLTTKGIKISVETFYQSQYSNPAEDKYVFAYRVTIDNNSEVTVQLLSRFWRIWDANNTLREVEGDGVIGKQPILAPGETHQYVSWSHLMTGMGKMSGYYIMQRPDGTTFNVSIPEFKLVSPARLN